MLIPFPFITQCIYPFLDIRSVNYRVIELHKDIFRLAGTTFSACSEELSCLDPTYHSNLVGDNKRPSRARIRTLGLWSFQS